MQAVFEKIIEKLEDAKSNVPVNRLLDDIIKDKPKELGQLMAYNKAIEIVKQEAEQYNNGWIPCNEKLPELRKDVLVTVKYTGFMGKHGYWVTTGHMQAENYWWGDCAGGEVIAWQPLPEPYQPKGE